LGLKPFLPKVEIEGVHLFSFSTLPRPPETRERKGSDECLLGQTNLHGAK